MKGLRVALVLAALVVGFVLQIYYLSAYPQPILFGDPGAYYVVGQKLQQAAARLADGEASSVVFESVRGLLYFAGVGAVYGIIDALSPQNIPYFRVVLSLFNSASMLGCFFLARRLSSSFWGGFAALVIAALYPPFSVQTGRLFPDPITGCGFVWSAYCYLRGVQDRSPTSAALSGVLFTAALFVRSQLFNYMIVLLLLAAAATAFWWWRNHKKLVLALLIGCAPLTLAWIGIVAAVGDDLEDIEAFGNFTFSQRYPYGFWQFLDSDGFMGPYRLGQEPYYQALEARAADEPALLESYPRQLTFTAGYVFSRPTESVLMLLDNVYRLYDRPANDYKWDYPFRYSWQVWFQKFLMVLAVAGLVTLLAGRPSWAFVGFIPSCLALLHALSYPWPRFNQPAMPILIAVAATFAVSCARQPRKRLRTVAAVLAAATTLVVLGWTLRMPAPELARLLRAGGSLVFLGAPFWYAARSFERRGRVLSLMGWLGLSSLAVAHDVRSPAWHETRAKLGHARQEIALSPEGLAALRSASESFVVFDLHVPDGDARGIGIRINGVDTSDRLVPTMPRFGESTSAGGRNRREYRQWWAVPLLRELLPSRAPATLEIEIDATGRSDVTLYGDRFRNQEGRYEGPSFGDWPHLAQVKLEYDGDYRLPIRVPLASVGTSSDRASVHRIRVITLGTNEGRLVWETTETPAGETALAFYAYTGERGEAELLVNDELVATFPLGAADDIDTERLCIRPEEPRGGMAYGGYVARIHRDDRNGSGPLRARIRFRSGMNIRPMFVSLDQREHDVTELVARCGFETQSVARFGEIIEAKTNSYPSDTGRWSVADVF